MKIISNGDAYADALSTTAIATVPFIAFGMLNRPVVLYSALTIGMLLFCIYLIRFFYTLKTDASQKPEWLPDLISILQLPYVFLVAALLLFVAHIDATPVVWVSLGVGLSEAVFLPVLREE